MPMRLKSIVLALAATLFALGAPELAVRALGVGPDVRTGSSWYNAPPLEMTD